MNVSSVLVNGNSRKQFYIKETQMFNMITTLITAATIPQLVGAAAVVGLVAVATPVKKIDLAPPSATRIVKHHVDNHYEIFGQNAGE
jgi:hypothetical protein